MSTRVRRSPAFLRDDHGGSNWRGCSRRWARDCRRCWRISRRCGRITTGIPRTSLWTQDGGVRTLFDFGLADAHLRAPRSRHRDRADGNRMAATGRGRGRRDRRCGRGAGAARRLSGTVLAARPRRHRDDRAAAAAGPCRVRAVGDRLFRRRARRSDNRRRWRGTAISSAMRTGSSRRRGATCSVGWRPARQRPDVVAGNRRRRHQFPGDLADGQALDAVLADQPACLRALLQAVPRRAALCRHGAAGAVRRSRSSTAGSPGRAARAAAAGAAAAGA